MHILNPQDKKISKQSYSLEFGQCLKDLSGVKEIVWKTKQETPFICLLETECEMKLFLFQVGQRIIEVNGQSLLGATHQEAVNILRNAGDEIKLLVCNGFNPNNLSPNEGNLFIFKSTFYKLFYLESTRRLWENWLWMMKDRIGIAST